MLSQSGFVKIGVFIFNLKDYRLSITFETLRLDLIFIASAEICELKYSKLQEDIVARVLQATESVRRNFG
jgi:hypothetical protein